MCVIDERELEMKKRVKQKITCKRNHFRKLGPPMTPCWRMESNCFNVGCPLHFQYLLSMSHLVLRPKPDAHRMYAQGEFVIHTARIIAYQNNQCLKSVLYYNRLTRLSQ
jgi:hypothetical protein